MPGLSEGDAAPDPIEQFRRWYADAGTDAVALVTASPDAVPSARMVLLKGLDDRGFAFFTNYTSDKARDLESNPRAALLFFWPPDRQVRVSGPVTRAEPADSERYWRTRPRGSQLSAWASRQSEVVENRAVLEQRVTELAHRFAGGDVPLPPFWGGYRQGTGWVLERLSP
jgi:pyridoxamine 5'-phosphate oxidase